MQARNLLTRALENMPTLETITESDLQGPLKPKSLRRAKGYLGRVRDPIRVGQTLAAQVRGSRLYDVEVDVEPDGINARCSCPYDWGGYCKHVGALVLKWIRSPETFTVEEPLTIPGEYPIPVTPVEPPPTHQPEELPFWLKAPLDRRRAADEEQLSQWLQEVPIQELRQIAEDRGWKAHGVRKEKVLRQIVEHLTDPGETLAAILALDDEHRRVLCALLLLSGGRSDQQDAVERLATLWGELKTYKQLGTYTNHLCEAGLAVPGDAVGGYPSQGDFIPWAISRSFPPMLSPDIGLWPIPGSRGSARVSAMGDDPPEQTHLADPYPLVQAVNQTILLLEQSPSPLRLPMPRPRLEKFHPGLKEWDYDPAELAWAKEHKQLQPHSGLVLSVPPPRYSLPDSTIKYLASVVGGEARLEFIYSVLVEAGVFQPGSPVTAWPEVKAAFLRQNPLTQRAILARAYFWATNWSVLWHMLRRHSESRLKLRRTLNHRYLTPQRLRGHLTRLRWTVLRPLASLPDGEWVAMRDLYPLMQALWPQFNYTARQAYSRQSSGSWFLTEADSEHPLDSRSARQWQLGQGDFIRTIITGPLHWLGLADLSFDNNELMAVRFHGLGDLFWDRVEAPPAPHAISHESAVPPEEAIQFDRHTITVQPSAISGQAHDLLSKIAHLDIAAADRFVYRVNPQTMYETFEVGVALSDILEGWDKLMLTSMPEAIRAQLTQWWESYGQVRIYENITLIEFGDEYALPEMKVLTSLEEYIIAEPTRRLVIIPEQAVETLVAELEDAGHTPKQISKG